MENGMGICLEGTKKRMIRCDSDKAFGVIAKVGDL